MVPRVLVTAALLLALAVAPAPAAADDEPAMLVYAQESGTLLVGLQGAGIAPLDHDAFLFQANSTHPSLRIVLDYAPQGTGAETEPLTALVLHGFHVDVTNTATGLTEASFDFTSPGSRSAVLLIAANSTATYEVDLYLMIGADVDWNMTVQGWRLPIPL